MSALPEQKFNDDILWTERDRDLAAKRFPALLHVLDFPELREIFLKYDIPATNAKKHRRNAGFTAIAFGVVALLGAAATALPQVESAMWVRLFEGICAFVGVLSVLVGAFGTLSGQAKQRWLRNRLMSERLRQFHFQSFICRLPEILASMGDEATRKIFLDERRSWLAGFQMEYEGHLPAQLIAALEDDVDKDFLLHHDLKRWKPPAGADANLELVFSAYRVLRFEHQIQYADYKLRKDESIFSSSSLRQLGVLRDVAIAFISIVFLAHLAIAVSVAGWGGFAKPKNQYIHFGIICVVIGILAVRTLEEGLQPAREVERYSRYHSSLTSLLDRFDNAADPEEKLRIMLEVERASYQEMRGFLETNYEARYVL